MELINSQTREKVTVKDFDLYDKRIWEQNIPVEPLSFVLQVYELDENFDKVWINRTIKSDLDLKDIRISKSGHFIQYPRPILFTTA